MNRTRFGSKVAERLGALLREETAGQALIEFALVAPLVLMLGVGMAVFGIGLNEDLTLTNATEVSSQLLAVSRGQTTDPCLTVNNAIVNASPNLVPARMSITVVLNGVSSGSLTGQPSTSTTAMCSAMAADMVEGANETITVTYPYSASFINYGTKSYTLSATVEQSIE